MVLPALTRYRRTRVWCFILDPAIAGSRGGLCQIVLEDVNVAVLYLAGQAPFWRAWSVTPQAGNISSRGAEAHEVRVHAGRFCNRRVFIWQDALRWKRFDCILVHVRVRPDECVIRQHADLLKPLAAYRPACRLSANPRFCLLQRIETLRGRRHVAVVSAELPAHGLALRPHPHPHHQQYRQQQPLPQPGSGHRSFEQRVHSFLLSVIGTGGQRGDACVWSDHGAVAWRLSPCDATVPGSTRLGC